MARHINAEKARAIAYQWHAGASCPIYQFASSGMVAHHLALLGSLRAKLQDLNARGESRTRSARDLNACYRFARDCLALAPGGVMLAPWARVAGAK